MCSHQSCNVTIGAYNIVSGDLKVGRVPIPYVSDAGDQLQNICASIPTDPTTHRDIQYPKSERFGTRSIPLTNFL